MRVKLFWSNNPIGPGTFTFPALIKYSERNAHRFQDDINAWLSENPRIRIVDIKQSASGGSFGASLWLISVWYEEQEGA